VDLARFSAGGAPARPGEAGKNETEKERFRGTFRERAKLFRRSRRKLCDSRDACADGRRGAAREPSCSVSSFGDAAPRGDGDAIPFSGALAAVNEGRRGDRVAGELAELIVRFCSGA